MGRLEHVEEAPLALAEGCNGDGGPRLSQIYQGRRLLWGTVEEQHGGVAQQEHGEVCLRGQFDDGAGERLVVGGLTVAEEAPERKGVSARYVEKHVLVSKTVVVSFMRSVRWPWH